MTVRPGSGSRTRQTANAKPGVPLPVLIGAIVLVLLIVGGLAYHYLGPQQASGTGHVRPLTADEQWVQEKAKETGGDFNKLTQEEQRRLFSIDGPKAPFDFRQQAHPVQVGR